MTILAAITLGAARDVNAMFNYSAPFTLLLALGAMQQAGGSALVGLIGWALIVSGLVAIRMLLSRDWLMMAVLVAPIVALLAAPFFICAWMLLGARQASRAQDHSES